MPGHTLKVTLNRDVVNLRVECHEPDGAWCCKACIEGCEDYCNNPTDHIKPIGRCLACDWINAVAAECYAGEHKELPLVNGMSVDVRWNDEQFVWKSAAESGWHDEAWHAEVEMAAAQ